MAELASLSVSFENRTRTTPLPAWATMAALRIDFQQFPANLDHLRGPDDDLGDKWRRVAFLVRLAEAPVRELDQSAEELLPDVVRKGLDRVGIGGRKLTAEYLLHRGDFRRGALEAEREGRQHPAASEHRGADAADLPSA